MTGDTLHFAAQKPALEAFLASAAGANGASIRAMRPLSGGAIQENWFLAVDFTGGAYTGQQTLVLRTDAPTQVALSLTRAQEFAVQRAAWQTGVTVAEPLWLCEDTAVAGRPFYAMRHVGGEARGRKIVAERSLGGDRNALVERLGRELARLHTLKPPRPDLAFLAMPDPSPAHDAIRRYRTHLDALGAPRPGLEWGLRWCEKHAPPTGELVLVHQDFRTGNYMLDGNGLTAILDWEFCAWGDPMSDIGWFCARCWRFGHDDLEAGGIAPRAPFYTGYEAESGRRIEPEQVAFWEVMAHIRWAVIAMQQGRRTAEGGEASLELALTGRLYPPALELSVLDATAPAAWAGHS